MRATPIQRILSFLFGWGTALLLFFPIAWMVLTSFKSERDATSPNLFFTPSLDSYHEVFARADYLSFALNSIVISVCGTVLALLFAIPAAYAMAFHPTSKGRDASGPLSTKCVPSTTWSILKSRSADAGQLSTAQSCPGPSTMAGCPGAPARNFSIRLSSPMCASWDGLPARPESSLPFRSIGGATDF